MERGDIYPLESAESALSHFFRPGNLIALRELALRQVTGVSTAVLTHFWQKDDTRPAHGARAHCRLHQLESRGAVFDRPRFEHGAGHRAESSTCSTLTSGGILGRRIKRLWLKIFALPRTSAQE